MKQELGDQEVEDLVIEAVCMADAAGEPIKIRAGYDYDKRLKTSFAFHSELRRLHQSVICAAVKQLVAKDFLRYETNGTTTVVVASHGSREVEYPLRTLLPA